MDGEMDGWMDGRVDDNLPQTWNSVFPSLSLSFKYFEPSKTYPASLSFPSIPSFN